MIEIQGLLSLALSAVLFGVKVFALVDCIVRKAGDFETSSQVSKNGWLVILGLAVAAHVVDWMTPSSLFFLNLIGTVAALVYLAQLRSKSF